MKEVYLVSVTLYLESGAREVVILNAFSSYRKARVYADFKSLQIVRRGVSIYQVPGACPVKSAIISLKPQSICLIDWSVDLKNLQDEKLSFELTKKYNLLEFV